MSILPLSAASLSVGFFTSTYSVQDYVLSRVSGEDVKTLSATRNVELAVDPSGSKRLENIFGGNVSDGDIGIWTEDVLYISDMYSSGETRKQTIFSYQGTQYLVAEVAPCTDQTGARVYRASRYVNQYR